MDRMVLFVRYSTLNNSVLVNVRGHSIFEVTENVGIR